ncbi:hypothetical protein AB0I28_04505 [Phytomonospora sp. NPDC050363]|uniref:hypothetical protein n=1 Tax=Phytomonospora sp. NPDC050363 TaxID=3155642 RepID=UPI0033EE9D53
MNTGADLRTTAENYVDDIVFADDIACTYLGAPESLPLPSVLIASLASIDTEAMRAQMTALDGAKDFYGPITAEHGEFQALIAQWRGDGASAFEGRWQALARYVHGDASAAENLSLVSRIGEHVALTIGSDYISGVVGACEAAQVECARYIREDLKAARTMGDDFMAIGTGLVGGGVTGAGVGALFAGVGAVPGAVIGGLVGAVGAGYSIFTGWAAETNRVKAAVMGMGALDDLIALDVSGIGELKFDPGAASSSELTAPWRPS